MTAEIRSPSRLSTTSPPPRRSAPAHPRGSSRRRAGRWPGWPRAGTGDRLARRRWPAGTTRSRPRPGTGARHGMVSQASSVSSPTSPSTSSAWKASAKPRAPARRPSLAAGAPQAAAGRRSSRVARARCRALLDRGPAGPEHARRLRDREGTSQSTSAAGAAAAPAAWPRTLRSTASWPGSGPRARARVGDPLQQLVGVGLEPGRLALAGGARAAGTSGAAGGRRPASRSVFRQRLAAIRYSQPASRPAPQLRPGQAATSVSCSASSASCTDPSIRQQCSCSRAGAGR